MNKSIDRTFTYRPPHIGVEARCWVRIYTDGRGGPATVVISELADNPGMSVTNASEIIASNLRVRYDLDPKTTTWIEHWPPAAWREQGRKDEQFDQVTYTWSDGNAFTPQWRRLAIEEVETMTGTTWVSGNLTDDTNQIAESFGLEWVQNEWEEI